MKSIKTLLFRALTALALLGAAAAVHAQAYHYIAPAELKQGK